MPADHQGNLSTIGGVGLTGMRTALSVPGAIDSEPMIFFVEEMRGEVERLTFRVEQLERRAA